MLAASSSRAGLVEVVEQAKRSVAGVGTYDPLASPRFGFRGTGFVVGDGNLLVTNAHVLVEANGAETKAAFMVQLPTSADAPEPRGAVVAAVDRTHDLALLRFDGAPRPTLRIADSARVREGLAIAFIGFPLGGVLGFKPVTHRGIVSSITAVAIPPANAQQLNERTVRALREGSFDVFQLDGTSFPGNSGGPLLDEQTGEVVGVINMALVRATKESALAQPTGITYAIPARHVGELLQRR